MQEFESWLVPEVREGDPPLGKVIYIVQFYNYRMDVADSLAAQRLSVCTHYVLLHADPQIVSAAAAAAAAAALPLASSFSRCSVANRRFAFDASMTLSCSARRRSRWAFLLICRSMLKVWLILQ